MSAATGPRLPSWPDAVGAGAARRGWPAPLPRPRPQLRPALPLLPTGGHRPPAGPRPPWAGPVRAPAGAQAGVARPGADQAGDAHHALPRPPGHQAGWRWG